MNFGSNSFPEGPTPAPIPVPPTRTYMVTVANGEMEHFELHNVSVDESGALLGYFIVAMQPGVGPIVALREVWAPGVWKRVREISAPMTEQSLIIQ